MNYKSLINRLVSNVLLESDENAIHITPEKYLDLLKFVGYDGRRINNLKQYRGKEIVIDDSIDVSGTDTMYLGNITVNGNIRADNSQLKSKQGVSTKYISYYGTPLKKQEIYQEFQRRKEIQNDRREEGYFEERENLSDVDKCTLALFDFLISSEYEYKTPEDSQRLQELYAEKERREQIEKDTEDDENLTELRAIDIEIEEIEGRIDIYDIIYEGKHYFLHSFKVLESDGESRATWAVGDKYHTEKTAYETVENLIDDVGLEGFRTGFVENHIDEEELKDYFRESEEDYVRENLEDFFDEDDFVYSDPQIQERIDEITEMLEDSDNLSQEQYDELNEELDELKDSDKTIPDDLIDDKVESLLSDKTYDAARTIRDYGLDMKDFIDMDAFIKDVVDTDGYGDTINSYDGTEDTVEFDNETYYIFQIDG
jgi:hypothetical protein